MTGKTIIKSKPTNEDQDVESPTAHACGDVVDEKLTDLFNNYEETPYLYATMLAAAYSLGYMISRHVGVSRNGSDQALTRCITENIVEEIKRGALNGALRDRRGCRTRAPWSQGLYS